jgi:hypothetical protein
LIASELLISTTLPNAGNKSSNRFWFSFVILKKKEPLIQTNGFFF